MIDQAKDMADSRGLDLIQSPTNPELARIKCRSCGWPYTPDGVYDLMLERYVAQPHGCFPCTWEATHGWRPKMFCNGSTQRFT